MSVQWGSMKIIPLQTSSLTKKKILKGFVNAIIWQAVMFVVIWFVVEYSSLR
jgi:hypothetical protein